MTAVYPTPSTPTPENVVPILTGHTINGVRVMARIPSTMQEYGALRCMAPGGVIIPGSIVFSHAISETPVFYHPMRGTLYKHLAVRPFIIDFTDADVIFLAENGQSSNRQSKYSQLAENAKKVCKINKGLFLIPITHHNFNYTVVPSFFMKAQSEFTKMTRMKPSTFFYDKE